MRVTVPDAKIGDYLLFSAHRVGRFKAVFFVALGAILHGPSGRRADIVTVWMLSTGQDFAHFITAHPA